VEFIHTEANKECHNIYNLWASPPPRWINDLVKSRLPQKDEDQGDHRQLLTNCIVFRRFDVFRSDK
jgi:hypothetical protein